MNALDQVQNERIRGPLLVLLLCLIVLVGAVLTASLVQTDFGRVEVTNVVYPNYNGIPVRAKLFKPVAAREAPLPGLVYIHGYQNNRETGDAYCLELARRGFVVLNIDAVGRGNSGRPGDPKAPDFDPTYGGRSSLDYLRSLPFVRPEAIGLMGHSLGAEMVYRVALEDPTVRALVVTGFAYTQEASFTRPQNMLMIIGQWDEYRRRMTGTSDIEKEWMTSPATKKVIPADHPRLGVTYGDFAQGTARRVFVPKAIHLQESHSRAAVAEALAWMKQALSPPDHLWIDPQDQTWPVKEWATLIALLAGFAAVLPLGLLLLQTGFFRQVQGRPSPEYACTGRPFFKSAAVNAVLMLLYLPLIFVLFGLHVYVVKIDRAFPMMMVNALAWWFVVINLVGFFLFRRWFKKEARPAGLTLADLGLSYRADRFSLDGAEFAKTMLLAVVLFAFVYLAEYILEALFIVDYRFLFPFASDLTPHRWLMFLLYLPFFLIGFVLLGVFLHGRLRRPFRSTRLRTFWSWSAANTLVLVVPLLILLAVQYLPLLTTGAIPLVGPGGMLATFVMNLFHVIGLLVLTTPISTWFYQLTGKIYLGAVLNALLVAWMLASSQVIAPIPV